MPREAYLQQSAYKQRCAANDLFSLSGGIALLMKGIDARLREDELAGTLTEEQEERLKGLFLKLHTTAEDVADLAREVVEHANA